MTSDSQGFAVTDTPKSSLTKALRNRKIEKTQQSPLNAKLGETGAALMAAYANVSRTNVAQTQDSGQSMVGKMHGELHGNGTVKLMIKTAWREYDTCNHLARCPSTCNLNYVVIGSSLYQLGHQYSAIFASFGCAIFY